MCEVVDVTDVLGVSRTRKGVNEADTSIYSFTRAKKLQHPRKASAPPPGQAACALCIRRLMVRLSQHYTCLSADTGSVLQVVCVQCGDFYEVMGYDAIVLVEHGGVNSMGAGAQPSPR